MKFTKAMIIVPALALGIAGFSVFGAKTVSAQNIQGHETLVQRIAEKFGLKVEDVQSVFDEERKARKQEVNAAYEQKLSDAVANGELTEEKKQLILAKHKELRDNREAHMEAFKDMNPEQMKAEMEKKHEEMRKWAQENGIDEKYLRIFVKKVGHPGFGTKDKMKFVMQ